MIPHVGSNVQPREMVRPLDSFCLLAIIADCNKVKPSYSSSSAPAATKSLKGLIQSIQFSWGLVPDCGLAGDY